MNKITKYILKKAKVESPKDKIIEKLNNFEKAIKESHQVVSKKEK